MIFQTDLILRSALISAIKDIRENPWTIDDIFSQTLQDDIIRAEFGKEIQRVRNWFIETNIPIIMQHRLDKGIDLPCISVALVSSGENQQRAVLGDGDFIEDIEDSVITPKEVMELPIRLLGPFSPKSFDPATGIVSLPDNLDTDRVFAGQFLLDTRNNEAHIITECVDESTFKINTPTTEVDFQNAIVIPQFQALKVARQRTFFNETYQIGCHASGQAEEALWLHSILVYILLRYKKNFLERRGIELSTFTSSDFVKNDAWHPQNVFSRFVTLQAVVEHSWVKSVDQNIEGFRIDSIKIIDGGETPDALKILVSKQGWQMELDGND